MSFISYAQNFEDVVLWRALKHVARGFYIDVGANDPQDDSVTKAFYERQWSGINCEPLQRHCDDLSRERPRDINLRIALGDSEGEIELWDCDVRGWATFDRSAIAAHENSGIRGYLEVVPLTTLTRVCDDYLTGDLHFLKIDVEGAEAAVLRGMDFVKYRPWIVVVEAMAPNSQNRGYEAWENILIEGAYQFVYFDGLNRFYVANEHQELIPAFAVPPNCFDDFLLQRQVEADKKAEAEWTQRVEAEKKANVLWQECQKLEKNLEVESHRAHNAELLLENILLSRSWRVTSPLRWVVKQLRLLREHGMGARLVVLAKKTADSLGVYDQAAKIYAALRGQRRAEALRPGSAMTSVAGVFNPRVLPVDPVAPESLRLEALVDAPSEHIWVRIVGHIEGHFSLAIVNRALAVALEEIYPGRVIFSPFNEAPVIDPTDIPAEQEAIIRQQLNRQLPSDAEIKVVSIAHHYPIILDPLPADVRLAVFFWEETGVPRPAVAKLNANFDVVLVAAEFVKRALRNSGCIKPILVIPMGLDHIMDKVVPAPGASEDLAEKTFRFLHISSFFPRKGPDVLLEAFFKAFTGNYPVELYIKTFANPHNQVHALLAELRQRYPKPPRVVVDETSLTTPEMLDLYKTADVVVLPARGEGFNLPAAESLAFNVPVIVTGAAAQVDFATQATATLIPYHYAYSSSHVQSDGACWFEPDVEKLAELMRALRNQVLCGDPEILNKTRVGQEFVTRNYQWARAATSIQQILLRDWREPARQGLPKLAMISSWACRCGIAEYARNLLSEVHGHFDVRVFCDSRTLPNQLDDKAEIAWSLGDRSIERLCTTKRLAGFEVVLVQHQPSLFALTEALCLQLADLAASGKVVVLELHATKPLLADGAFSRAALKALRQVTRIVVHNVDGLNHLLQLGLADNVFLLPHGVINKQDVTADSEIRASMGLGGDDLLLGSFGFALPHKGVDQIIESIKPLEQKTGRRVGLLAVNAMLDERSSQTIAQWQKLASSLGVADRITWVTDYRPIDACINLLAATDFVIYPYRDTQESASGAVTMGLSSGRPVLVSDSPIFAELQSCCYSMDGAGRDDIVRQVIDLCNRAANGEVITGLQNQWLEQRSWQVVSKRLANTLSGLIGDLKLAALLKKTTPERRKRLFVDVSELYRRDAKTGIQRVVHSILAELFQSPPKGFDVYPVYSEAGETYRYTAKFSTSNTRMIIWDEQEIDYDNGDVFLGLDLTAHLFPAVETLLTEMRQAGVRITYVLFDILPVTHPEYFPPGMSLPFVAWLHGLSRQADNVVAISQHSANAFRQWLLVNAPQSSVRVGHFHLGSEFMPAQAAGGLPDDFSLHQKIWAEGLTCVAVGTLEPRKGYADILDAFDTLWKKDAQANLIIVGKPGWKTEKLVERIRNHPMIGQRLFWFESASDECLEACYEASDYLIAASYEEGFGLPIAEALRRGVPVLARDIAVFREVGGDSVTYFNDGENDLCKTLLALIKEPHAKVGSGGILISWSESKAQLLQELAL